MPGGDAGQWRAPQAAHNARAQAVSEEEPCAPADRGPAPRAAPRANRELRDLLPDVWCVRRGPYVSPSATCRLADCPCSVPVKRWPHAKSPQHAALCEALDGVLEKVRGLGAVAEPFMVRVTRADAPGYAELVTSPMDLGTMSKKLRAGAYLSAAAFEADIELIAANAARFNGPGAPYTIMAAQLRDAAHAFITAIAPAVAHEASAEAGPARSPLRGDGSVEAERPCYAVPSAGSPPSNMQTPELEAGMREPGALWVAESSDGEAAANPQHDELLAELTSEAYWKDCTQPGPAAAAVALPPLPLGARFRFAAAHTPHAASEYTELDASAALRAMVMVMLRDAGFSAVEQSALELLTDVTADRLGKLGTTLRQLSDASARAGLDATPGMLRASDGYVSPAEARDCMRLHRVHWQRFSATTAAITVDDAAETHAHKRPCLTEC